MAIDLQNLSKQLHARQYEVHQCNARFRVLVAGRRFGKTHLALTEMVRAAMAGPDKLVWYVGPNEGQSKTIAWERLKEMTRAFWAGTPKETALQIDLVNGSKLAVKGAFHPASLRGVGLDFVVIDECASMKAEAWRDVLRPALADTKGRALFIGTPQGRNHFYELFHYAQSDPAEWAAFQFTTAQGGLVDAAELASAARQLDSESYKREFEADFSASGTARVYHAFDRVENVQTCEFQKLHPLIWSLDFNVNPMCMLLMQRIRDEVYVLEEMIIQPEATTEAACQLFHQKVWKYYSQVPPYQRPLTVEIYGDASGNQKRTSGASTDWTIVRQYFKQWATYYRATFHLANANPAVRDRVNCVNARLRNHEGTRRLFVDPGCVELIKDLDQVTWSLDPNGQVTSEIDKSDKARTHASDALGYYLAQAFSMKPAMGHQPGFLPLG